MQFTGDTPATWQMMAFEARFTADEAAAGISNVSDDIGSFHGNHLADDMYARWVQLGTFQPIDRLHSDHGDRLPWNYGAAADASAEKFLRLREALVPYTYTLARQANTTGVPIIRPLYLNYPTQSAAYTNPGEYLYGDNVLVSPITTASDANGNGSSTALDPAGHLDRLLHRPHVHRPGDGHDHRLARADAGADQGRRHHADPHRLRRPRHPEPADPADRQRGGRRRRHLLALPGRRRGQRLPERPVDDHAD